jgi:hypothetical protein
MLRISSCLMLALGIAVADESKDAATWVAELSATYAKLDGFTATYTSKGEGKSLKVVMGMDETSDLGALHLTATKDGRPMETRQWNTDNDELFMFGSWGGLIVISGIRTELQSLSELNKVLVAAPENAEAIKLRLTPAMLISKTTIHPGFDLIVEDVPTWTLHVRQASVQGSDETSVTFLTEEFGLITVSRETGLLTRQSVTSATGEVRVLELKEHLLNPGREEISKISAGWKTEGAKIEARGSRLAGLRLKVFQAVVNSADAGGLDMIRLEKVLGEQRDALRRFADGFTSEIGGSLAGEELWKEELEKYRNQLRMGVLAGTGKFDEKEFEAQLADFQVRLKIRDELSKSLDVEGTRRRVMWEIFGKMGRDELKATGKAGEAAKLLVESAINRAYLEAVLERKMTKYWGERVGLD